MTNIWQQFAVLNNMTLREFDEAIIEAVQNILATTLKATDENELKIGKKSNFYNFYKANWLRFEIPAAI